MNEEKLVVWYKENLNRFQGEDREAIEYMFKTTLDNDDEIEVINVVQFSTSIH